MILSKAPLRVSLIGGGSDFPEHFSKHGGAVLGGSIDKYVYSSVLDMATHAEYPFRFTYRHVEERKFAKDIEHPVVRRVLLKFKEIQRINIATFADIPGNSGLGSSSAFTVSLIGALNSYLSKEISQIDLAMESIAVERTDLHELGGWQDQIHASLGGFNLYEFSKNGGIAQKNALQGSELEVLNSSSVLVKIGQERNSSTAHSAFVAGITQQNSQTRIGEQAELAREGFRLLSGSDNYETKINALAEIIRKNWNIKKGLIRSVEPNIERIIFKGFDNGALAAKLCGAGQSGYIFFLCNQKDKKSLSEAFDSRFIQPFSFIDSGFEVTRF